MPSETQVLDNTDLAAMIQEATGEAPEPSPPKPLAPRPVKGQAPEGKSKGAPVAENAPQKAVPTKPEVASPHVTKPAESAAEAARADADGLTAEERTIFSEKMRKSIAWRHGKMREAQELAQREKQGRLTAEERAKALEGELQQLRTQAPLQPRETAKEPVRADFGADDEYIAARVKWDVTQELTRERAEARKREEEAELTRLRSTAGARIKKAMELVPDFAEVTGAVDIPIPTHIAGYMQESEMLAELGYFFAQHPDELERLKSLKPVRALVELGKIESTLKPFSEPIQAPEKVEANGASAKPSTAADGNPSKPRVSVPVIQPLNARGAPEVLSDESTLNGRQAVSAYERRSGHNLGRRQRH